MRFENECPKFGVSPRLTIEGSKTNYLRRFSTTSRLNRKSNLVAYIFETTHDRPIDNRANASETTTGLLHVWKCYEFWSTNGLKLDPSFYPPFVNSAFYFIAKPRIRRSANGAKPNFAKHSAIEKLGSCLRKNWRPKSYTFVFRWLWGLMNKTWYTQCDDRIRARIQGFPTSSRNFMNFGPKQFSVVLDTFETEQFCRVPSAAFANKHGPSFQIRRNSCVGWYVAGSCLKGRRTVASAFWGVAESDAVAMQFSHQVAIYALSVMIRNSLQAPNHRPCCKLETGSRQDKTQFTPHFETGQNCKN